MSEFYAWLGEKKSARIRLAVMDMWKAFRLATQAHAPQAAKTLDHQYMEAQLARAGTPSPQVIGGLSARNSSRSRFTLPQRRHATRRTSNSRNIRVSPHDRSRTRRTVRSYQPIWMRPQQPQAVF